MPPPAPAFAAADLVGGHPALDFVNTCAGWNGAPRDRLGDYPALLAWADRSGAVPPAALEALRRRAADRPREADAALAAARAARAALYAVLHAGATGATAAPAALAALDARRIEAATAGRLEAAAGGGAVVAWSAARSGLRLVEHVVVAAGVALLAGPALARLGCCAGPDCGWLFLDRSAGGRRRWCDMATCGNVAKARRHLARRRSAAP